MIAARNIQNDSTTYYESSSAMNFIEPQKAKEVDSLKFFGNDNYNFNYPFAFQNFDLHGYVVQNPKDCFLIRVKGDSMTGAGISNSDVLLVDKSKTPRDGSIVVAEVNGKLVVKKIKFGYNQYILESENTKYKPIYVKKEDNFLIWGVVQSVIKTM